jgi:hypothetical protein
VALCATAAADCPSYTAWDPTTSRCLADASGGCPAGRYKSAGNTCEGCARGTFGATAGRTTPCVQKCSRGRYGGATGLAADAQCSPCSAGRFGAASGVSADSDCAGHCSLGTWSDVAGLAADAQCKRCSQGRFDSSGALGKVVDCVGFCSVGRWSNSTGLTADSQCTNCSAGRHGNEQVGLTADASCTACKEGSYSPRTGQVDRLTCEDCSLTQYATAGWSVCATCSEGFVPTHGERRYPVPNIYRTAASLRLTPATFAAPPLLPPPRASTARERRLHARAGEVVPARLARARQHDVHGVPSWALRGQRRRALRVR